MLPSLLEAAHIASAAHRRSTAQVHAACSRVPITSRTSNRAIQVSCCVNVAHMDRPKFFSPACWIPCGRSHSSAIFAALISAAHLSISLWMNSWRYSGDLRSGATKTEPNSFRRSSVAGALIAATVALWSFCTITAGRALGQDKGKPGASIEISKALLVRGRQIRKGRRAVFRQDRDPLDRVALDVRDREFSGRALIVDPARNQLLHRGAAAAVGNVRDVNPDRRIEPRTGEMDRGAHSGRAVLHLRLVRFRMGD